MKKFLKGGITLGTKDLITKSYVEQNEIFADAFNYLIYGGKPIICGERLKELDASAMVMPYGKRTNGQVTQRVRDVMKYVTAMTDDRAAYLLLGIENQSEIHYAMPVKNLLYDALQYAKQVEATAGEHHRRKDYKGRSSGEFLSGFYKEDRLLPVITLVIFFGPDTWDGPTSLHEMFVSQEPEICALVPDYRIHLIAPGQMSDEELKKFRTSLRDVLTFIKYSKDKQQLEEKILKDERYKTLGKKEAEVLNVCVDADIIIKEAEEVVDVCLAIEEMKKEAARQAAKEATLKATRVNQLETARRMKSSGRFSDKEICEFTLLQMEEIQHLGAE